MAVKETIDIEALLYRAYAQMRVDRMGAQAAAQMLGLGSLPVLASSSWSERVDTSAPGSRLAARAKEASSMPDDLLALHDRVLALADLWFAWEGDDVALWDSAAAEQAGFTIGKAGGDWWLERAGKPVARLEQAGVMGLIIQHARDGSRPEVHLDWRKRAGRRPADQAAHDHRGRRRKGEAVTQREVQYDRALYHAWRCALVLLQAELDGEMEGYLITGPLAPAAPWLAVSDLQAEPAAECQNVQREFV
ncbi:hypothetical protein FG93_05500 [Bosea sp. LC85]|uniref:hypothetical protein n=1 Tax=Bosea sp. LC85 TaxID=1502851 RepID=UPI0004E3E166|nr:hypothetical protein [Bosea sp. LC85]KFC63990.1 hypothetical protein FG93_05500 [Bosea sp. LC85]